MKEKHRDWKNKTIHLQRTWLFKVENPTGSKKQTSKKLEEKNLARCLGYKVSIQKSIVFIHIGNIN